MNSIEKRNKYAYLMSKLKKATYNEFYYEAIFIEYAIIEDRTESILRHADVKYDEKIKLEQKLNKIKSNPKFCNKYCKKHFNDELIEEVRKWKYDRNNLIHSLVKCNYDEEQIKNIALYGECIAKKVANKSKLINNYFDNL